MSGVGLREEQRWKDGLVTRIVGFLPVESRWCHRWQASSHRICTDTQVSDLSRSNVGAGLPAMGAEQAPQNQDLGIVATMDGR